MQAPNLTPKGRNLYAFKLGGDGSNPFSSPSKDIEYLNGRIGGRLSRSGLQGPGLQVRAVMLCCVTQRGWCSQLLRQHLQVDFICALHIYNAVWCGVHWAA